MNVVPVNVYFSDDFYKLDILPMKLDMAYRKPAVSSLADSFSLLIPLSLRQVLLKTSQR